MFRGAKMISESVTYDKVIDRVNNLLKILESVQFEQENKGITFDAYIDYWYAEYKVPWDGERALSSIAICIRKYLKPFLKNLCMNAITKDDLLNTLESIVYPRQKEICYNILNGCFRTACQEGVIKVNPVVLIKKPKAKTQSWEALTMKDQERFINAIKGLEMEKLFKCYLLTGCRLRELLNVKWSDVDFNRKYITIKGTKTKNAVRTIPLTAELESLLNDVKNVDIFIFPYNADRVYRNLKRVFQSIGLNHYSTHCLRHTFATRCIERGVEPYVLKKWLGHASITTTLNIYTHVQHDFENEQVMKISDLL